MQLKWLGFALCAGALIACPSGDDRGGGSQSGEGTGSGGEDARDAGTTGGNPSGSPISGDDAAGRTGSAAGGSNASTGTEERDAGSTTGVDPGTGGTNDAGIGQGGHGGATGGSSSSKPCPIGRWSQRVNGAGTCDGTEGEVAFVITEGASGSLQVVEELTNVQTGPGCDWEFDGSATFQDGTLEVDLVRDDNGCEKHILITFTVDDACGVLSTDGDFADVNCESCNPACMGCGTETCTGNYGPGSFDRE